MDSDESIEEGGCFLGWERQGDEKRNGAGEKRRRITAVREDAGRRDGEESTPRRWRTAEENGRRVRTKRKVDDSGEGGGKGRAIIVRYLGDDQT